MSSRHFRNPWLGRETGPGGGPAKKLQALKQALQYCLQHIANKPSVYTGAAGIAYACWHVLRRQQEVSSVISGQELLEAATQVAERSLSAVEQRSPRDSGWSLLAGHADAQAEQEVGRAQASQASSSKADECLRRYRELAALATSPACHEDELLYGRVGYLFGALMLNRQVSSQAVPQATLQGVVQKVLSSGRQTAAALRDPASFPTPLFYVWPPGPEASPYLGAAHGLMGILYVLLHFADLLNSLPGMRGDVEGSLAYLLSLECDAEGRRGPHGHYPTQMGPWRDREPLVHWCHGATGAVFLFCQAHEALGGAPQYLQAALRSGDTVWERGLLRKGPGLCHGVSGNAYALLKLYRTTQDPKWLRRAECFADFMNSEQFRQDARTPDHPHSLFEGWGAAACLWADLLHPERGGFPFFELDT